MLVNILCGSSMRRMVPDTQAADRRTLNSKPSDDMRVTHSDDPALEDIFEYCW